LLTQRWQQLNADTPEVMRFKTGPAQSDGQQVSIPLLSGDAIVTTVTLSLPNTFPDLLLKLDKWVSTLASQTKKTPLAAGQTKTAETAYENAIKSLESVDPRYIALGLGTLDELWHEGHKQADSLRAAARGYAMLVMVLDPDPMGEIDTFAAEALAFFTLAKQADPGLKMVGEEALIAMNMGYETYAESLISEFSQDFSTPADRILAAYLRRSKKRRMQRPPC
jgi:hypothetical protein